MVAEKAGERLRFSVVHDQRFFEALHTPHKQFTPTCDHDTYMNLLGQSEIAFMPLGDTPFNRAKSDLKFIEAAACRVASLASPIVYADSIEDGRTGAVVPRRRKSCATDCCAWWRCRNWRAAWAMRRGTTSPASA